MAFKNQLATSSRSIYRYLEKRVTRFYVVTNLESRDKRLREREVANARYKVDEN